MSAINDRIAKARAAKIPAEIRKKIIEEKTIEKATPAYREGSEMEFLFDVYLEFIDSSEFDDFTCPLCRARVYESFVSMHKHLKALENVAI